MVEANQRHTASHPAKAIRVLASLAACILLASALVGCTQGASSSQATSSNVSPSSASAEPEGPSIEQVKSVLEQAFIKPASSFAFSTRTESSALVSTTADGKTETERRSVLIAATGEIDQAGEAKRSHVSYAAQSSSDQAYLQFEAFIEGDDAIIVQSDGAFRESAQEAGLDVFVERACAPYTLDEAKRLVELSQTRTITEADGITTISLSVDAQQAQDESLIDVSTLPAGSKLESMTVRYTLDAEGRVASVRTLCLTKGAPTCQLLVSCEYADYDTVQLPDWPELETYLGIETAEDGTMYYTDDEGNRYIVDHVDDDGTMYYYGPIA